MDCIDAANGWYETVRFSPFLSRNLKPSPRDMGTAFSQQQPSLSLRRPVSRESTRAPKRQRIGINELVEPLEKDALVMNEPAVSKSLEEPPSLVITPRGLLDKYGDEHESLIPRHLDGVPVKTRCSVQIYYSTSECRNGTLTDIHEELLRVSQEGNILTTWNHETGCPETEIHLPHSFVLPIRDLYVPKPRAKPIRGNFDTRSEIPESDDDSDDILNQGEYGFADKYFCHFSFATVCTPPWPPLALDSQISRTSLIGRQLQHRLSHKRDLRLVSKTELLPANSLSIKAPLEIKLGPDRQSTQYQLLLDTKWTLPESIQQTLNKVKTPVKPSCIWRIEIGGQAPSVSKMNDSSCRFCRARFDSIKLLHLHLRANYSRFEFDIAPSTTDEQCFVITVSDKLATISTNADTPVHENAVAEKAASVAPESEEAFGRAFNSDDQLSSPCDTTPEPLSSPEPPSTPEPLSILEPARVQRRSPEPEQPLAIESPASATTSEPLSKKSSPNTTPDSGSDSDDPLEFRKRIRDPRTRRPIAQEDNDSSDEDTAPTVVVPKTVKPLFDIATKRLLKPGEQLPPSTVSYDWRIQKHKDLTNDYIDITPEEKDFINQWDAFIFGQRSTSKIFLPSILEEFITMNRQWFDDEPRRKVELLKHLMTLTMSGRIEEKSYWECLEMFQGTRTSPRKSRADSAKHNGKSSSIIHEETLWIDLWDSYAESGQAAKSLAKFLGACETLCTQQSMHASPGQAMLGIFLSFHSRTLTKHALAKDNLFYNSNYPHPAVEGERKYVRYFDDFKEKFVAKDESDYLEQLVFAFLAENTAWLTEEAQRIKWAKKHLQELHWDGQIKIKFREKSLAYLDIVEAAARNGDLRLVDVADGGKGKETTATAIPAFKPPLTENDRIQGPRPRNVRAFGECECGGHARAGEAVICAGATCIARVYHRACVSNAPKRGTTWHWYCAECEKTRR